MATKRLIDEFKCELMSKFIDLCRGNDFNKLTLLEIGETIDSVYEKYRLLPTVDAVEVVRCEECLHYVSPDDGDFLGLCTSGILAVSNNGQIYPGRAFFCPYGERKDNG